LKSFIDDLALGANHLSEVVMFLLGLFGFVSQNLEISLLDDVYILWFVALPKHTLVDFILLLNETLRQLLEFSGVVISK
jgi:hypothetical protein